MKTSKIAVIGASLIGLTAVLTACDSREKVVIWTSTEDYNMELMQTRLDAAFPNYNIVINYDSTSNIAAKVIEEGEGSSCDIVYAEEYGYMEKMIGAGVLDSIEGDYDLTRYVDAAVGTATRNYVLPAIMTGGAVVINKYVLAQHGITAEPTSYDDLLDPAYQGLVSMASPKSSGTGYMFLYSLVKAWGRDPALTYFDNLTSNILAYTSSGSGPINALVSREAAVGFGMISQAVTKINDESVTDEIKILFFDEGAPFNLYGNAIVKGKKARPAVKAVMDYLDSSYTNESCGEFYPEPVLKNVSYHVPNFPTDINYADMEGNNLVNKEALLALWNH